MTRISPPNPAPPDSGPPASAPPVPAPPALSRLAARLGPSLALWLERIGWATLLPLFALGINLGPLSLYPALLLIPAACHLAIRHGRAGVWLLAIAAAPMALPVSAWMFELGPVQYAPWAALYACALILAWLILQGPDWRHHLPPALTRGWALVLALLPLSLELAFDAVQIKLNAHLLVYLLVAALAASAVPARQVLGLVALLCLLGGGLDYVQWATGLAPLTYVAPGMAQDWFLGADLSYRLDAPGDLITAAIVYAATRYLASFDRHLPRSLPGRRLPAPGYRVGMVLFLALLYLLPGWSTGIERMLPFSLWIGSGDMAWLATCLLAGFWLGRWGAVLLAMTALLASVLMALDGGYWLRVQTVLLPLAVGHLGLLWRCQTRGETLQPLPWPILRSALLLALALLTLAEWLVRTTLLDPSHVIAMTLVGWFGIVLLLYRLLWPGVTWPAARVRLRGGWADLLTLILLGLLALGLWEQIADLWSQLSGLPLMLAQADPEDWAEAALFLFALYAVAVLTVSLTLRSLFSALRALSEAPGQVMALIGRRQVTLLGRGSDLPGLAGLDTDPQAPGFMPAQMRALGLTLVLTVLSLGIVLAVYGPPSWPESQLESPLFPRIED